MTAPPLLTIPIELRISLARGETLDEAAAEALAIVRDDEFIGEVADAFSARYDHLRKDLRELIGLPAEGTDDEIVASVETLVGVRDHLARFITNGATL